MNFLLFMAAHQNELWRLTFQHLILVLSGVGAACLAGIPAGIAVARIPALRKPVLLFTNVFQTIPSLALFGFLIPALGSQGIGRLPAIIALFLYSLLPVIRNTFSGLESVDPAIREAGIGMGMTSRQLLTQVEFPLAFSVILAGVRIAAVTAVGTATIAAAIGAGGLGTLIFRGLRMNDNTLILAGAVPAALMALAADALLGWMEKASRFHRKTRAAWPRWLAAGLLAVLVAAPFLRHKRFSRHPVVIGSKDFTEQVILGEVLAQTLENYGHIPVERKFELGGDLCHRGMLSGDIDGYVEYTGTALVAILKYKPLSDPEKVYQIVKQAYRSRFGVAWLPPLGLNDTFAILVRGDRARRLRLKKISDIIPYASRWRAAFGQDFMSRKDGYTGFVKTYGIHFADPPREMDLALTYRALAAGQVDIIAGNATDGMIPKLDLYPLADDRRYFPPYEAAPVFRQDTLRRFPQIRPLLARLSGRISNREMRQLNEAVDIGRQDPKSAARRFLTNALGPVPAR